MLGMVLAEMLLYDSYVGILPILPDLPLVILHENEIHAWEMLPSKSISE